MTKPEDRLRDPHVSERQAPPENAAESQELDTEIVRDLELDEQADGVRGGICASSHVGVACQPQ